MNDAPYFYARDRKAWRAWLLKNHDKQTAVWLVYDKGPNRTMNWEDIVQEALCFGWVDSRPGKVSETKSKIYISRRKPKSVWSKINKAHIAELTKNGQLQPAGQAAIDTARQNGSWDALNDSDNLVIPPEMKVLFTAAPEAQKNFDKFSESARRMILQWIYDAKRPETKSARIQKTVELAKQNLKANEYRAKT